MAPPTTLSVVLATAHPGPALHELLRRLVPQLDRVGGELVLVDGTSDGIGAIETGSVPLAYLHRPGADVFTMRAAGAALARGWIVGFAEDHCMPADDGWAEAVLEAHRRHGDRAAVTGAVRNGTTATAWDRGSFLLTFATVLDPLPAAGWRPRTPPAPANLSIKREVLDTYELTPGLIEFELAPHLVSVGHLGTAPEARMEHHQAHAARWFLVHHFHNGRSTGGLVPRDGGRRVARRRVGQALRLPAAQLRLITGELRRRPGALRANLSALPCTAAILCAHATGQAVGVLAGPGLSPQALE